MKKYIAIQQENYNFDWLIDDDGIKSAGGLNCEVFGFSLDWYRNNCFLNKSEYEEIYNTMEAIVSEFDDLTDLIDRGYSRAEIAEYHCYNSYKDIVNDILRDDRYKKYSSKLIKDLKSFVENYGNDSIEDFVEFLNITTNANWECKSYRGYCQGDIAYMVYCTQEHTEEYIDLIGNAAVGCACEFCISENPLEVENRDIEDIMNEAQEDCCHGYFLIDTDVWNEEIMKEKLSQSIGCKTEEIEVIVINNTHTVTHNEYKIA